MILLEIIIYIYTGSFVIYQSSQINMRFIHLCPNQFKIVNQNYLPILSFLNRMSNFLQSEYSPVIWKRSMEVF